MKIEIEVKEPTYYADAISLVFIGGANTSSTINITSGTFDLKSGTKFVLDQNGNLFRNTERTMNRLTHGGYFCDIVMCRKMLDGSPCDENGYCLQHKVWERLKAYEDTGLDPEKIKEIIDAIDGGLSARDGIICPECGDALAIDVVDGVLSIGCFGCKDYTPISKLMKLHNELRLREPVQAKKEGR